MQRLLPVDAAAAAMGEEQFCREIQDIRCTTQLLKRRGLLAAETRCETVT
jgi:hypothetical protein